MMTDDNTSSQTTIGHFLRESREGKKVSLKIVSQHTRISLSMLENLELDQLDQLPSKAYVRGFVKSYAKTLGLNETKCIDLLESTYQHHFPRTPERVEKPRQKEASVAVGSKVKIIIGLAAALVVVVVLILESRFSFTDSLQKDAAEVAPTVTPESLTQDTPLQNPTPLEDGEQVLGADLSSDLATATTTVAATPTAIPTAAATPVATPTVAPTKAPALEEEITFRPFGSSELYTFDKSASAEQLANWLPASIRTSMVPGKQNVFINALKGDSWLTYREDQGDIKKFVLKEGRTMMLRGDLVLLFLGNIGGVKVFLNNQLLSLESRSGVKSIIFPQEERTRFSLPLFVYPKDGSVWTSEEYQKNRAQAAQ